MPEAAGLWQFFDDFAEGVAALGKILEAVKGGAGRA